MIVRLLRASRVGVCRGALLGILLQAVASFAQVPTDEVHIFGHAVVLDGDT